MLDYAVTDSIVLIALTYTLMLRNGLFDHLDIGKNSTLQKVDGDKFLEMKIWAKSN